MRNDSGTGWTLYAKTGWTMRTPENVGWFVGYVETGGKTWLFAANMELSREKDMGKRKQMVMDCLRAKKIIQ
jgi:beta-lactamase class D